MHAIGHYVLEHNPNAKVVYLSSEKFTNEFINSIRDNKAEAFRNKYRSADVLLIDDIQFLAGKESTQEEFFHTFNTLHEESKQIVISSDRPPREIPTLEDRLRSTVRVGINYRYYSSRFRNQNCHSTEKGESRRIRYSK